MTIDDDILFSKQCVLEPINFLRDYLQEFESRIEHDEMVDLWEKSLAQLTHNINMEVHCLNRLKSLKR